MAAKKVLIIFPYGHLAYSPTTLQVCRLLHAKGHNVKVVYGFEEFWGAQKPVLTGITFENISYSRKLVRVAKHIDRILWKPIAKVLQKLSILNPYNRLSIREILFSRIIKKTLETNECDEMIAVDILPLYWAQKVFGNCHLLSLEVDDGMQLRSSIDRSKIMSVVIQSEERFQRLFDNSPIKHFLVQNAPNYVEPEKRTHPSKNLIYNGTAWAPFGATYLLEFANCFPEYKIHFKGSVHGSLRELVQSEYRDLVGTGIVSFSETYLNEDDLKKYLADFSVGFCFYDFAHPVISQRRFNYETAPSGKVFLYLSVGIPVIATRIRGFSFLEENIAGILLDDHRPETIKNAVDGILKNYKTFSDNALATGRKFSFDESAKPFIDFISQ